MKKIQANATERHTSGFGTITVFPGQTDIVIHEYSQNIQI
jgi:hypothetical protein